MAQLVNIYSKIKIYVVEINVGSLWFSVLLKRVRNQIKVVYIRHET